MYDVVLGERKSIIEPYSKPAHDHNKLQVELKTADYRCCPKISGHNIGAAVVSVIVDRQVRAFMSVREP